MLSRLFLLLIVSALSLTTSYAESAPLQAIITTNKGVIELNLLPTKAPLTTANFINLATRQYYDGMRFHRVVEDFMVQTGDPLANGSGGPGYKFRDEFKRSARHNRAGTLAMANSGPDSNGSQFYITYKPTQHLDFKHTVFGYVRKGMPVVFRLLRGDQMLKVEIKGDYAELLQRYKGQLDEWNEVLDSKFAELKPAI